MFKKFLNYYMDEAIVERLDSSHYFGEDKAQAKQNIIKLIKEMQILYDKYNPEKVLIDNDKQEKNVTYYFIGDIHGAFFDLHRILMFFEKQIEKAKENGKKIKCIFLGDYVDRNNMDIHSILFLFAFNLKHPKNLILLRGNHEERQINRIYGFSRNIHNQFDSSLYDKFAEIFRKLPLLYLIKTSKISLLALHGGIPINLKDTSQIINIEKITLDSDHLDLSRMDDISQQILWNDPLKFVSKKKLYTSNLKRGGSFYNFGALLFEKFLEINKLGMVIRGHQVFPEGHKFFFDNKLLSLFSASEYIGMNIDAKIAKIQINPNNTNFDVKILRILNLNK